jgi:hypothetical protein
MSANVESDTIGSSVVSATHDALISPTAPTAYPMVQPVKAALYFDSVDGFGDWRILISTRADKNLREAKRDDQKLFAIFLKKIRFVLMTPHNCEYTE